MFTKLGRVMVFIGIALAIQTYYCITYNINANIWLVIYWIWLAIYLWNPNECFYNKIRRTKTK